MNNLNQNPINTQELADKIDDLARITAEGFASTATKQDVTAVKEDIAEVKTELTKKIDHLEDRFNHLEDRFNILENKVDRALYHEIEIHEKWIKQLADKVGIQLVR